MLTALSTTRRGRRAAIRSPRSRGTGRRAETAISQAVRRGGAGRVGQGVDRAGAGRRGPQARGSRGAATPSATAVTSPTAETVSDGAPASAEEAGTGVGEQGSGQPSGREPGCGREQGQDQVLGEQHDRDQARRAADRLEQPDAPGLVGHPAADEDGDAGHGEQAEQPAADLQEPAAGPRPSRGARPGCPATTPGPVRPSSRRGGRRRMPMRRSGRPASGSRRRTRCPRLARARGRRPR